jgi:hypothetical protein
MMKGTKARVGWIWAVAICFVAITTSTWTADAAPAPPEKDLRIYFVDVEGGQATLFVTPAGQ